MNSTRPLIAFVSFSLLSTGGIETHLLQILRGLRDSYSFQIFGTLAEPFLSEARSLGADCVPLSLPGKASLGMILRLRSEFLSRGIALVHTHETRAGLLGRIAGRLAGCCAIHTIHTPSFFLPQNPLQIAAYQIVEAMLNRFASDRVIFVSPTIERLYESGGLVPRAKAICIPNGLEDVWLNEPRAHAISRSVAFLYAGRLSPEKGIRNLAKAFTLLSKKNADVRLIVAGDGEERGVMEKESEDGGWRTRCEIRGRISRDDLRSTYAEADAFVLPSRFESMSYTLLEAMACGLPCIATDAGGNRDLVEEGVTGLLVPPETPAALAEAMERLAANQALRAALGAAGRKKALRYTQESMLNAIRAAYHELI